MSTLADSQTVRRLTGQEINGLDPYIFMAVIGKKVIHPGGRRSTRELLERAGLRPGQQVLDVGCGVATTAIEMADRFGACVTAVDISPLMIERARRSVQAAGMADRVTVTQGDILALDYPDNTFDCVMAEAVTMFVNRPKAARELVRVCRPGGRLLATEFLWRRAPTPEARRIFLGEVCPGLTFDSVEDWVAVYEGAGLGEVQVSSGPFEMMSVGGFVADEGPLGSLKIMLKAMARLASLKKMMWLMPRMNRAVPYLGYITVSGVKPE